MARRRFGYRDFFAYEPTRPREVEGGLKARSKRGAFVESWWAGRWIEALERLVDPRRLQRGRRYARKGQVVGMHEREGRVEAEVQGSRRWPYKARIALEPLDDAAWERVTAALAERALFTAQLLVGEMPREIEAVFEDVGASLFPESGQDLVTDCSCPDWANPCKHVAAVHYLLGERFDEDPFLLLRLRGRHQDRLLEDLRARRGDLAEDKSEDPEAGEETEEIEPLEDAMDCFWEPPEPLDGFAVRIEAPDIDQPLLRRLGDPGFVPGEGLGNRLRPVLQAATELALRMVQAEDLEEVDSES